MSLHSITTAIENLPFAVAIAESSSWFPTIETAHVFALTLVVGSIAMIDLRLLQVSSRSIAVTKLSKEVLPWTWGAFILAALTGALLFSSKATFYSQSLPFRMKLICLALAGVNMAVFHFVTYRTVAEWDEHARVPRLAKMAGALSLLFWIGVVAFGRWIGFVDIQ